MILGWEDIAGGPTLLSFLVWLGLTGLFYLVCYLAVLTVVDDFTKNHWLKIPVMLAAAIPSAGVMAVLHYKPWLLCLLAAVANYFRVRDLGQRAPQKFGGSDIPLPLFYGASYGYLALVLILASYFQSDAFLSKFQVAPSPTPDSPVPQ